ncbi:MAG: AEC family transporter [Alphaproteobacteria bacterium]|nr:AEC family transporter [Alphaproteobacteria bacterium]
MNILIEIVSPFFCFILIGYIFGRLFDGTDAGLFWLNKFIIYLAVPALLFSLLIKSPIEEMANFGYIATTTLITFSIFAASMIYLVFGLKKRLGDSSLLAASASYGNVGYMGIPLMVALLGEDAIIPATLILIFDSMLHFILVPLIAGRNDTGSNFERFVHSLMQILKNPFLIASVLGVIIALFNLPLPSLISNLSDQLGASAIPTALFSLGVSLSLSKFTGVSFDKVFLVAMKLFIHPALVAVIVLSLGIFDPIWSATAIIMATLPTALNVFMMAKQYERSAEMVSSVTLFGTIISVGSISLVIYLVDVFLLKMS